MQTRQILAALCGLTILLPAFPSAAAPAQPLGIAGLIASINDEPDLLHADYTPAVLALAKIGVPALKQGVLELLLAEHSDTRLHAERVLELIIDARFGFRPGLGFKGGPEQEEKCRRFWKAHGSYSWEASAADRRKSYELWKVWLAQQ